MLRPSPAWLAGLVGLWVCLLATAGPVAGLGPPEQDSGPVPATDAQREEFLRTARVVRTRPAGLGITDSLRVTLSDGHTTHDAHVQSVDVQSGGLTTIPGQPPELNFRDSYKFNVAAYLLDRAIGLHMVPVSVERVVNRKSSAVTWWVDDVQMMELDRYRRKIQPPDVDAWNDQMFTGRVFTELIYNTDPNLGNFLITSAWRLHLVDFTRAFRLHPQLRTPANLGPRLARGVYEGLRALDLVTLRELMGGTLTDRELRPLLARRDIIVAHFDRLIAERGEAAVLYVSAPSGSPQP